MVAFIGMQFVMTGLTDVTLFPKPNRRN